MDIDIKKRALSLLSFDLLKVLDLPFVSSNLCTENSR